MVGWLVMGTTSLLFEHLVGFHCLGCILFLDANGNFFASTT